MTRLRDSRPDATLRRRWLLLSIVSCALLSTGCGEPRGVTGDHIDLVVFFIEDIAHGQQRNPLELKVSNATAEMNRIALWLGGIVGRESYQPPQQLANRRDRWPEVKALFVQGHAVVLDNGLIAANPKSRREDQTYALPIVDAENLDRRSLEALVISIARCTHAEAKTWVAQFAAARIQLDTQAGAQRWVGRF